MSDTDFTRRYDRRPPLPPANVVRSSTPPRQQKASEQLKHDDVSPPPLPKSQSILSIGRADEFQAQEPLSLEHR